MPFYYVKNGGTATGDGGRTTTQRTGLWNTTASEYYDDLENAVQATTTPTDGDFILCSDLHSTTSIAGPSFNSAGSEAGSGLQIISVDNANQENYKPGASDGDSQGFRINNNGLIAGIDLDGTGLTYIIISRSDTRYWKLIDSIIRGGAGLSGALIFSFDGISVDLINVDIDNLSTIQVRNATLFRWHGGTLLADRSNLFKSIGASGGATIFLEGVDLSLQSSALLAAFNASAVDVVSIKFVNCELHASVILPGANDLTLPQHIFEMRSCDDSTGGDTFRFHYQTGSGKIVNNESVFVTGETAWGETSDKSSVEVTTTSRCSHVMPFVFELPVSQYVDLAVAASDVIRIPITTTLTLTDTEIAAFLMYPDGTTAVQANWVTSGKTVGSGNYGIDPLAAGSTLPTSTTAWTGQKTNRYHLELDTTGDAGQAQALTVRIEVYRASIAANTLMLATEFELS